MAEIAAAIYRVNGSKNVESKMFNPAAAALYQMEAAAAVPPASARIFLRLYAAGSLPSWVPSCVDLALIKASADG